MEINQRLALLKEWHQKFSSLVGDAGASALSTISESQKSVLKDLAYKLYRDIENLEAHLSESMFDEGAIETQAEPNLLRYYRENIVGDKELIAEVFEETDPGSYDLFLLLDSPEGRRTSSGHVFRAFEVGLEKMDELLEECPEFEDAFLVRDAWGVLGSNLIKFAPDNWIENGKLLKPILTGRKSDILPVHVKFRLEEIYRSFIFENWLSVVSLSRSALEYAILDNCHKWGIQPKYKVTYPREEERDKDLKTLIEEISSHKKELYGPMDAVRDAGNQIIHPKKTNRDTLLQRRELARKCIGDLTYSIEVLYLPREAP